jgi:hypothetical protein
MLDETRLELRFGLEDGRCRTLEEVGHELHVTRERIRQIEAKGAAQAAPPLAVKEAARLSRVGLALPDQWAASGSSIWFIHRSFRPS